MNQPIYSTKKQQSVRIAKPGSPALSVRPTLVVGLGGTGCCALQWFNDLVRQLFGGIPPFIKMLAIDSDEMEDIEQIEHRFPKADFYNVFEDIHVGDIIKDYGNFPAFHPALRILEGLDLPSAIVERGCQGISRLGRVVFFQTMERVIYRAVFERFDALRKSTLREDVASLPPVGQYELSNTPVVHIISSVCGGTGSGMLLDMAYALQHWGKEAFNREPEVFAHLLLPEAFRIETRNIMDKLRAVGNSVLKQIEFFMDHRRPTMPVEYPGGTVREFAHNNAPFDACYLINGHSSDGGGSRDELVQLIARMVRSMVIEPAAKPIFSDLNNKQQDILSAKDSHTKRMMCFSSYGLGYGTVQHPETDSRMHGLMRQWFFDGISTNTEAHFEKPDQEDKGFQELFMQLKAALKPELIFDSDLKNVAIPEFAMKTQPAANGAEGSGTWQQFMAKVEDYVNKTVHPSVQAGIKKVYDERYEIALKDLHAKLQKGKPLLATARVYEKVLLSLLSREGEPPKSVKSLAREVCTAVAARANTERAKRPQMDNDKFAKTYMNRLLIPYVNLELQAKADATPRFHRAIKLTLAEEMYRQVLRKLLQEVVQPRVEELQNLSDAAKMIELHVDHDAGDHQSNGSAKLATKPRNQGAEAYSISLFELRHPEQTVPKHKEHSDSLNRIVQEMVNDYIGRAKKDAYAVNGESISVQLLKATLAANRKKMTDWMKSYGDLVVDTQFRFADASDASAHPLFESVQKICRRLTPKIAVNKNARHDPSMRVVVAQFPSDSCLPILLRAIVGSDFRKALIDHEYARKTGTFLQLMHFGIGFCLPAIDNIDEYETAEARYLLPNVFQKEDLWLDPVWYQHYQRFLERVEEDAQADKRKEQDLRQSTRQRADDTLDCLSSLESLLRPFFVELSQACKEHGGFEQGVGMECHSHIKVTWQDCLSQIITARKLPMEELQHLPRLSNPIMEQIENDLLNQYLIPQVPMFAATVQGFFNALRTDYDDLLMHYEASRGL